uniref:Uncharacterized protein LOC114330053 n=1 Tax=Diabrotica virgifera virgifera TaxID=50390 RepID=A0A6P7FQ73_DIAVI
MLGVESLNKCVECGKVYKRKHDLRRHVKSSHPDKLDLIAPLKVLKGNVYKCTHCDRQFSYKPNLNYHLKKVHSDVCSVETRTFQHKKCSLCDYSATFKKDFIKHYETSHSIPMEYDTIEFSNHDDFISWKNKIELETNASFIAENGKKAGIVNYICHRSGYFISKGKGERHLKRQGSNKINGYCPAMIKEVAQSDGKYLAHFTKTHVGHYNEIEHLFLSPSERKTIAMKLAVKTPFEAVLHEVRDGILDTGKLQRRHLLTKKDLYNIQASFNLPSTRVRRKNAAVNNKVKVSSKRRHKTSLELDTFHTINFEDLWQVSQTNELSQEAQILEIVEDDGAAEPEIIFEEVDYKSASRCKTLAERKEEMLQYLYNVVNGVNTEEEWKVLEKMVNPIEPTLAAISLQTSSNFESKDSIPSNSKILKQRQLFITKKKPNQKKQLTKPTSGECDTILKFL